MDKNVFTGLPKATKNGNILQKILYFDFLCDILVTVKDLQRIFEKSKK